MMRNKICKDKILELASRQRKINKKYIITEIYKLEVNNKKIAAPITIKRAIDKLVEEGKLIQIEKNEYKKYYINDDERLAWYTIKKNERERALLSKLINKLKEEDTKNIDIAIRELRDKYYMTLESEDLDELIIILNHSKKWNNSKIYFILEILENHIIKGAYPTKKHLLQLSTDLRQKDILHQNEILIKHILGLLGLLRDHKLVDIIDKLADKNELHQYLNYFDDWKVCISVYKFDLEILDLEFKYGNDEKIVDAIYTIRKKAKDACDLYKGNIEPSNTIENI